MAITTVVKTIGSGGDFTTLQSWEDAKPLDLTDSRSATTQAGSTSSTIALDVSASATTGAYVGHAVYCTARPAEKRLITAYDGTSKVATVGSLNGSSATWATTPGTEAFTIDQCIWQGQIKNATDYFVGAQFANVLTISGSTSSSACSTELTTAPGASWRDNATVATNALRYNPSNGCAIEGTPAFAKVIETAEYAHLSNLQCFATATGGATDSFSFTNTIVQNCILDFDADQARCCNGGSLINCLIVSRGNSPTGSIGVFVTPGASTSNIIGCTIVNSKANGYIGVGRSYFSVNIQNCAIFGFLNSIGDFGGTPTWTITTCATDRSTAVQTPGWIFNIPYSTATFQNVTESTRDYRLVSGSSLIGIGTTDAIYQPTDITGVTRPQGTGYDIGCWEFTPLPTHESYLAFDGDANTYAISAQPLSVEPYWIKIDLGSPLLVDSYTYQARAGGVYNAWKTWILEGSNNNSTWTLVDTVTNNANFSAGETRTYVCDASGTYRYWRWTVTASEGLYADVAGLALYNNRLNVPNFLPNTWTTHSGSTLSGTGSPFTLLEDASNGEHSILDSNQVPLPVGDYCLSFEYKGVGPNPRSAGLDFGDTDNSGVNLIIAPDGSTSLVDVYGANYIYRGLTITALGDGFFEGRLYFSALTSAFHYDIGIWLYSIPDDGNSWQYQGLGNGSGAQFRSAVLTKNYLPNIWPSSQGVVLSGAGQPFTLTEDGSNGWHWIWNRGVAVPPGNYCLSFELKGIGPTPRGGSIVVSDATATNYIQIGINPDGTLSDTDHAGTVFTLRGTWITAKSDGFWDARLYLTSTIEIPQSEIWLLPYDYQGLNNGSGIQFRNAALVVDQAAVETGSVTGTLSRTEQSDTLVAVGGPRVGGTLSRTEQSDTLVAVGGTTISGTLARTEQSDTLVSAGSVIVGGTLARTEATDVITASGSVIPGITGTLTANQAAQTLVSLGTVSISGTLSSIEANDTIIAAGGVIVSGTVGITEANDTIVATGGPRVSGTLGVNEATDTLSATGGPVAAGVLTANQANNTIAANGSIVVGGTLSINQAANTIVATGGATVQGTLLRSQANQTVSATGSVLSGIVGTLAVNQSANTLVASGTVPVVNIGTLNRTQANNTLIATGGSVVAGTLNTIQAANILSATATNLVGATLSRTQANQTLSSSGTVVVGGTLGVIEANDTISSIGNVAVGGTLGVVEANDTIVSVGNVAVRGTLSVIEATDTIAAAGSAISGITASLIRTQANQTVVATATITGVVGGLTRPQAAQTLTSIGSVVVGGTLTTIQASNTLAAYATANITATLGVIQTNNTINASAAISISGTVNRIQTNNTINARADVVVRATLARVQNNNSISSTGVVADVVTGVLAVAQNDNVLDARASVSFTTIPPSFPIYSGETNGRYIVSDKQNRVVTTFGNKRTIVSGGNRRRVA